MILGFDVWVIIFYYVIVLFDSVFFRSKGKNLLKRGYFCVIYLFELNLCFWRIFDDIILLK